MCTIVAVFVVWGECRWACECRGDVGHEQYVCVCVGGGGGGGIHIKMYVYGLYYLFHVLFWINLRTYMVFR